MGWNVVTRGYAPEDWQVTSNHPGITASFHRPWGASTGNRMIAGAQACLWSTGPLGDLAAYCCLIYHGWVSLAWDGSGERVLAVRAARTWGGFVDARPRTGTPRPWARGKLIVAGNEVLGLEDGWEQTFGGPGATFPIYEGPGENVQERLVAVDSDYVELVCSASIQNWIDHQQTPLFKQPYAVAGVNDDAAPEKTGNWLEVDLTWE